MAINLKESFQVNAPIDAVWQFLLDPHQVAPCMPGAELDEVVGDDTFLGNIKVKVGPIVARYKGRVQFTRIEPSSHEIEMTADGREAGGGTARGTISSRLQALDRNRTEVVAEATAEITGRVAQFGRGMIQGISQQLFREFAASVTQRLESPELPTGTAPESKPIRIIPLVLGQIWRSIAGLFRKLFRRSGQA
ncbi:MAG TPA: SRPBCC family protein [Dehalococcoidia bacterium]|nr:SRPBCC family protein [Dehalococcoidia bacterium]